MIKIAAGVPIEVQRWFKKVATDGHVVGKTLQVPMHDHEYDAAYMPQVPATLLFDGDQEIVLRAGDVVLVPKGIQHGWTLTCEGEIPHLNGKNLSYLSTRLGFSMAQLS
jgi:hypothetical protein